MKKERLSIMIVTLYLIIYTVVGHLGGEIVAVLIMFSISPLLIAWMVLTVLKNEEINQPSLGKDEEWGYGDVTRDQLGIF